MEAYRERLTRLPISLAVLEEKKYISTTFDQLRNLDAVPRCFPIHEVEVSDKKERNKVEFRHPTYHNFDGIRLDILLSEPTLSDVQQKLLNAYDIRFKEN